MLLRTLQVLVHCEHQTLWNMLIDRLQHPERYLQHASEVRITQESEDVFISEMTVHGEKIKERVLVRPYEAELRFELLEHPRYQGIIARKIVKSARQSPVAPLYLEYDLEMERKSYKVHGMVGGEEEMLTDLETEMQKVRSRAEETDARGGR